MANVSELYGRTLGARATAQAVGQAIVQEQVSKNAIEQNVAFQKSESINKLETQKTQVNQQASDIDVQIRQQNEWVNKSVNDDTLSGEAKSGIVKQYNQNVRMLNAEKSQLTSQIPVLDKFISEIKSLPANQYYDANQVIDIAAKKGHETYLQSAYTQAKGEQQGVNIIEQRLPYGTTPPSFKPEYDVTKTSKLTGITERVIYSPEGKEIGAIPITGRSGGAAVIPKVIETKPQSKIAEAAKTVLTVAKAITPFTVRSELSGYMPYTKEEYERLQKIITPPTLKEKLAFGVLPYFGKRAEMIQLSSEISDKVNDASKFTQKVTPIIDKEFKDLTKYDNQYASSVKDYNNFLQRVGTKKPDGTYELSEENYNDALRYEKSLNILKTALDNKINEVKDNFKANDIKFNDKADGLQITDERIKRIGSLRTYSQAYLKDMEDAGKLVQGEAILGTLGLLETAGWVVALTPVLGAAGKLPIVKNVLGVGKYIAKPIKVASALTIGAGITASSAYSRYKEYLPVSLTAARYGAVSGALETIGGYALGATLINIVDNVNLQKGIKENIRNILEDKSGELSPEKRRRKAQQKLEQIEKDVSNKIIYTNEQADFEFKNADYNRQKDIVKQILRKINSLPTQEEKLQGLLDLTGFLKRNIGKEQARLIVEDIFISGRGAISYGTQITQIQRPMVVTSLGRLRQVTRQVAMTSLAGVLVSRTAQAQTQAQKTSQQLSQRLKQEQQQAQKSLQASAQKYAQQVKQAQALAQKQEQKLMQQLKQPQLQVQRQVQKQEQQQKQISRQAQSLIQQQKVMQDKMLRQAQRLKFSIKPIQPIEKKRKLGIPTFDFEDKSNKKRKELELQSEQAYQTLIKRGGKFKPIGKPMQKARAEKFGEFFARTTLARTFKVIPTKLRVKPTGERYTPSLQFRGFKIEKGRKVPLVDTFIQKAKYSLSARSEVAEIQKARLLSKSMSQKARSFLR
jgi:hypothetical protein